MTKQDDDEPASAGIPERTEHIDSGAHVTESGRHVTNRNVVQRSGGSHETSGLRDLLGRNLVATVDIDDAFNVVTPVRPPPRDIFDEGAGLSRGEPDDEIDEPTPARGTVIPAGMAAMNEPPRAPARGPRIMPADAGFTPPDLRRPTTEPMVRVSPPADAPSSPDERSEETAGGDHGPRPPVGGFIPPESRRPGTERGGSELAVDARRPTTVRGHVEPRRRPTTPPAEGPPELTARAVPDGMPRAMIDTPDALAEDPGREAQRPPAGRLRPSTGSPYGPPYDPPHDPADIAANAPRSPLPRPGTGGEPSVYERSLRDTHPSRPSARAGGAAAQPRTSDSPRSPSELALGAAASYERHRAPTEPARADRRRASPRAATARYRPRDAADVSPRLDRVLRGAMIAVVLAVGAVGLAQPASVLRGGAAWLGFVFFVLSGWGAIVSRVARTPDPDAGLRAALGAAGYVAVAGVLLAAGVLTRPAILALIGVGFAGFAWHEATAPVASWRRVRAAWWFVRGNPALGVLVGVLVGLACVRMLGAVAALDRNPWDDDIAYTPFVKRLLDTGDLVEPFSFRRLGAYGGQTVLAALGAARGTLANVHLIDKGLGLGLALLVAVGHARERRTRPLWLAVIALVLLLLPDTAINTASYWTGAAMFLALYRVVVREHWALVGLVAAVTCTLRQNFLAAAGAFVAGVLIARLVELARTMPVREAWHAQRRSWTLAIAVAAAVIVPWWIAAYLADHTFLFPLFNGTWNRELSLRPAASTWPEALAALVTCCLEAAPIVVIPLLALAAMFTSDRRPGRPLTMLTIASTAGFIVLALSIAGSEPYHTWRYVFGFATALSVLIALEIGAEDDSSIAIPSLGRWLVLAAFVLQIAVGRGALPKQVVALFDDVREAMAIDHHGDPSARAERRRYAAMQAVLPAGEPVVVMLDDPALLDYSRNPIANLDTPGFASPGAQLPAFRGAEALRTYLVGEGYRYAAFVRSGRSRYFYRRPFWVQRMFTDGELYQIMSAYTIDAIDSLAELATTTKLLYDGDGLVVLDLASPLRRAAERAAPGDEPTRRGDWVRELADREGLHEAWSLTTRADLRFEDGFAAVRYAEGAIDDPAWTEISAARPAAGPHGTAILPMYRRAHLRVRAASSAGGATDMRLVLRAAVAVNTVHTRPRLDVSIDGVLLTSAVADPAGRYAIAVTVPRERLTAGWHDLYLVFSSIADPDNDIRELRVARLESVEWSPP